LQWSYHWLSPYSDRRRAGNENSVKPRFRLLRDTNGDGTADVRKTFAESENGLVCRAACSTLDGSFFLGNTLPSLKVSIHQGQQLTT